ncbi:MAG: hypothetical protein WCE21_00095 [Candidatus Babeliales bacterium]
MLALLLFLMCLFFNAVSLPVDGISRHQRNLAIVLDLSFQETPQRSAIARELLYLFQCKRTLVLTNTAVWENVKIIMHAYQIDQQLLSDWKLYKKDDFLLFMSEAYKKQIEDNTGFDLEGFERIQPDFSINTSLTATLKKDIVQEYYRHFPYGLQIQSNRFITVLKTVLLSKLDNDTIEWNIYLSGHGATVYQTVGITEEAFKELLLVFENHINTHTFYYSSCFAGGKIADLIFKDRTFSFPIFTEGLDGVNHIVSNYELLFTSLEKVQSNAFQTYTELASCMAMNNNYDLHNVVATRLPNTTEFTILPIKGFLYTINNKTTVADLSSTTVAPLNYVVETPHMQFGLFIHKNQSIISGMRGNSCHYMPMMVLDTNSDVLKEEIKPHIFALELVEKFKKTAQFNTKKAMLFDSVLYGKPKPKDKDIFFAFHTVLLFINDDIAYWPKLNVDQNHATLAFANQFNLFFEYNNAYFFFRFYDDNHYDMMRISPYVAQKYLNLFAQNKESILKGEQPIWQVDKILNNATLRKCYPWFITATAVAAFCIRIKLEYDSIKRRQEIMEVA